MARRRIRNLRISSNDASNKRSCCGVKCVMITLAIMTAVLGMLIYYVENQTIAHRLRVHVDHQYNYHMYGKFDYCDQHFEPNSLIEALKSQIISQCEALDQIVDAIEHLENVTSLAFIGGSGVGKTLTCNILKSNFQWPSNVFYFVWSAIDSPVSQYYKVLKSVQTFSSKCGAHLVIIDNLGIKDIKIIEELNLEIQKELITSEHVILIVYVFNLSTYLHEDIVSLDDKRAKLQNLNGIKSVYFRSFNRHDVERCIELESQKLNLTLSNVEVEELLEYIDWSKSGCKLIYSKIVMFT